MKSNNEKWVDEYNIEIITKLMKTWKDKPMYTRTDSGNGKQQNLLDVKGMVERKETRYAEVTEASNKITDL